MKYVVKLFFNITHDCRIPYIEVLLGNLYIQIVDLDLIDFP